MSARWQIIALAIGLLAGQLPEGRATELVINGGFEAQAFMTTDPGGNQYRYVPGDIASITGWTFTTTGNGENSYLITAGINYGTVPEGSYAFRLAIGDAISQTIMPPSSGSYRVSIQTKDWQMSYSDLLMTIGGTSVVIPIGFTGETQLIASLSGSTALSIGWQPLAGQEADAASEDFNGHGVVMDAISVTAVPEPSSWVVALAGIVCGAWGISRRGRQA
jgi:hypothetical protein